MLNESVESAIDSVLLNRTTRKFEDMCAAAHVDLEDSQKPSKQAQEAFRLAV